MKSILTDLLQSRFFIHLMFALLNAAPPRDPLQVEVMRDESHCDAPTRWSSSGAQIPPGGLGTPGGLPFPSVLITVRPVPSATRATPGQRGADLSFLRKSQSA